MGSVGVGTWIILGLMALVLFWAWIVLVATPAITRAVLYTIEKERKRHEHDPKPKRR